MYNSSTCAYKKVSIHCTPVTIASISQSVRLWKKLQPFQVNCFQTFSQQLSKLDLILWFSLQCFMGFHQVLINFMGYMYFTETFMNIKFLMVSQMNSAWKSYFKFNQCFEKPSKSRLVQRLCCFQCFRIIIFKAFKINFNKLILKNGY